MTPATETADPTFFVIAFGVLILITLFLFYYGIPTIKAQIRYYLNKKPDWERDATGQAIPTPKQHKDVDQKLRALGMRPLGISHGKLAYHSPTFEWIYHSESGYIYVEIVYDIGHPMQLQYVSCFPDGAMIITRYPDGENITTANYVSRFAKGSIDAALDFHKVQLENWKARHGTPIRILTMDNVLHCGELFRTHYQERDFQWIARLNNWLLLLNLACLAISIYGLVFVVIGGEGIRVQVALVMAVSLLVLGFVLAASSAQRGAVDDEEASRKKKQSD